MKIKTGTVDVCFISPLLLEAPVLTVTRTWPRPTVPVLVIQHQGPLSPVLFEDLTTTIHLHLHLHPSTFTFTHDQEVSKPIGLHGKFQQSESSPMGTIGGFVSTSTNLFNLDAKAYVLTSGHILSPSHHDATDAATFTDRKPSVAAPPDAYVKTVLDSLQAKITLIEKGMEDIRGDDRPEARRRFKQWSSDLFEYKNDEWHWASFLSRERSRLIGHVEYMDFGLVENGEVQVSSYPSESAPATSSLTSVASSSRAVSTRESYPYSSFSKGQLMFMPFGLVAYLLPHQDPARDRYWKDHIPVTVSMDTDPSIYVNGLLDIAAVKVVSPDPSFHKFSPKWGNMTFGVSVLAESWVANDISGMVNGQASIVLWNKEYLKSIEPEFDIPPGGNTYLVSREFVVFNCDRRFCKPGESH
ncbi:hypothetical protein VNI00_004950 [Paramarasmius palmivorus]|uniref:Uncharacterized protein n=1 Tax=Paramarasmius palmivorus TaxID=297713 RepID=A0AAW0DJJ7_9AGAR